MMMMMMVIFCCCFVVRLVLNSWLNHSFNSFNSTILPEQIFPGTDFVLCVCVCHVLKFKV